MSVEPEKVFVFESILNNDNNIDLCGLENNLSICRLCGESTQLMMPVFEGQGLLNNLAEKILKYLSIEVTDQDTLPQTVCYDCTNKLLTWHEFYCRSASVDNIMRSRCTGLQKQIVTQSNGLDNRKSEKVMAFVELVKSTVIGYLDSLEGTENCDIQLVCNKCDNISAFVEDFATHLDTVHSDEIVDTDRASIENFINNHVTFDETLDVKDSAPPAEAGNDVDEECTAACESVPAFRCPRCPSWFTSAARLASHAAAHGGCCDARDGSPRRHAAAHLAAAPAAACRACSHLAPTAAALAAHVRRRHPPPAPRPEPKRSLRNQKYIPAVCPQCNETFSNKYNMFAHLARHDVVAARSRCEDCGRSYSSRGGLAAHRRVVHAGCLPHACASCAERFPTRLARDVHARSHAAAAPYVCPHCPRAYRAADTLRQHLRAHANLRPHACPSCDKCFRKKSHLDYHLTTHR